MAAAYQHLQQRTRGISLVLVAYNDSTLYTTQTVNWRAKVIPTPDATTAITQPQHSVFSF